MTLITTVRVLDTHLPVGGAAVEVSATGQGVLAMIIKNTSLSQCAVPASGVGPFMGSVTRVAATLTVITTAFVGPGTAVGWRGTVAARVYQA